MPFSIPCVQFDWTLLHFAAYHGHMNVVRKLITVCQLPSNAKTKVRLDALFVWRAHEHYSCCQHRIIRFFMVSSLQSFDIACCPPHCVAWLDTSVCGRMVKSC